MESEFERSQVRINGTHTAVSPREAPSGVETKPSDCAEEPAVEELLIEEVSIDGMCGVY